MKEKLGKNPNNPAMSIGLNQNVKSRLTSINQALAKLKVIARELWMQVSMKNSKDLEGDE